MGKKIKEGYYKIGETARGKGIFVLRGAVLFTSFRHIGGILQIRSAKWYIVLSWFDGQCGHNDVVQECETLTEAKELATTLVGKRTGRWKEPTGSP